MAQRTIPNLPPVVMLSPTAQFELVQDGSSYRVSAQQIANLPSANPSLVTIRNDTTTSNSWYPLFAKDKNSVVDTLYTSDPTYTYIPYEARLTAQRVEASQGIVFNNSVTSLDYTFPTGDNGSSAGPITLNAVITVPTGSEWAII